MTIGVGTPGIGSDFVKPSRSTAALGFKLSVLFPNLRALSSCGRSGSTGSAAARSPAGTQRSRNLGNLHLGVAARLVFHEGYTQRIPLHVCDLRPGSHRAEGRGHAVRGRCVHLSTAAPRRRATSRERGSRKQSRPHGDAGTMRAAYVSCDNAAPSQDDGHADGRKRFEGISIRDHRTLRQGVHSEATRARRSRKAAEGETCFGGDLPGRCNSESSPCSLRSEITGYRG